MKNAYNYFFNKMNLWLVYFINVIFMYIFTLSIFTGLSYFLSNENLSTKCPSGRTLLKVWLLTSFYISLIFGLFLTFVTSSMRKSRLFWDAAEVLRKKVEQVQTEEEIMNLQPDFNNLKTLCQGSPHIQEYINIVSFAKGKIQGVKTKQ